VCAVGELRPPQTHRPTAACHTSAAQDGQWEAAAAPLFFGTEQPAKQVKIQGTDVGRGGEVLGESSVRLRHSSLAVRAVWGPPTHAVGTVPHAPPCPPPPAVPPPHHAPRGGTADEAPMSKGFKGKAVGREKLNQDCTIATALRAGKINTGCTLPSRPLPATAPPPQPLPPASAPAPAPRPPASHPSWSAPPHPLRKRGWTRRCGAVCLQGLPGESQHAQLLLQPWAAASRQALGLPGWAGPATGPEAHLAGTRQYHARPKGTAAAAAPPAHPPSAACRA